VHTKRVIWLVVATSALALLTWTAFRVGTPAGAIDPSVAGKQPSAEASGAAPDAAAASASAPTPPEASTSIDRYTIPNLDNPQIAAEVEHGRAVVISAFAARDGERYQVNNLSLEFASLAKQAAAGDLMAARTLFESLERCDSGSAREHRWLEHNINSHLRDLAKGKPETGPRRVMHEASIANAIEAYRRCAGVTDEQLATRGRWNTQLAEAGDIPARFRFMDYGRPTENWREDHQQRLEQFKQQAWRYLEIELQAGNPLALEHMGHYYANPRITQRDPFKMYMYWYAYAQTPETPAHMSTYMGLNTAAASLTAEQIAEAERQGRALYERCCKR
jgi:hypothetical protein